MDGVARSGIIGDIIISFSSICPLWWRSLHVARALVVTDVIECEWYWKLRQNYVQLSIYEVCVPNGGWNIVVGHCNLVRSWGTYRGTMQSTEGLSMVEEGGGDGCAQCTRGNDSKRHPPVSHLKRKTEITKMGQWTGGKVSLWSTRMIKWDAIKNDNNDLLRKDVINGSKEWNKYNYPIMLNEMERIQWEGRKQNRRLLSLLM